MDDRPEAHRKLAAGDIWGAYLDIVEAYKRISEKERSARLERLSSEIPLSKEHYTEDFGLLDWQQVTAMEKEGLIDFGVHTATHQILTQMKSGDEQQEIDGARKTIEKQLGRAVTAFCYPNGRPGVDFNETHQEMLRQSGFRCAFSTSNSLFDPVSGDIFSIGRIPAGNDATSWPEVFRRNCAGMF